MYVQTASNELPREDTVDALAQEPEPVRHGLLGWRLALDPLGAADPAEDALVVCAQELRPLSRVRGDRDVVDPLDPEAGLLERGKVVLQRPDRKEELAPQVVVGRPASGSSSPSRYCA